jgi:hypothetical protein
MRNPAIIGLVTLLSLSIACSSGGSADTGKVIKSAPVGNLTVTLSNKDGVLRHGDEEFTLSFKDAAGKPVEVGAASLIFHMPTMGTMSAMSDAATLTTTNTPGVYRAKVKIEVAGEWQTQVTFDGPAGRGQTSFPVTAQ